MATWRKLPSATPEWAFRWRIARKFFSCSLPRGPEEAASAWPARSGSYSFTTVRSILPRRLAAARRFESNCRSRHERMLKRVRWSCGSSGQKQRMIFVPAGCAFVLLLGGCFGEKRPTAHVVNVSLGHPVLPVSATDAVADNPPDILYHSAP